MYVVFKNVLYVCTVNMKVYTGHSDLPYHVTTTFTAINFFISLFEDHSILGSVKCFQRFYYTKNFTTLYGEVLCMFVGENLFKY